MPEKHKCYQAWNGDRFRSWANQIGINTYKIVNKILSSKGIEEQSYLTCRSLLKLSDIYSAKRLEEACYKALQFSKSPNYKAVKNILIAMKAQEEKEDRGNTEGNNSDVNPFGITRGARYYGGDSHVE